MNKEEEKAVFEHLGCAKNFTTCFDKKRWIDCDYEKGFRLANSQVWFSLEELESTIAFAKQQWSRLTASN